MAGAYISSGNAGVTSGSSHSASVTIPGGTDLFIIAAFRTILDANSPAAPTSATVAGNAATAVAQTPTGDQNTEWIKMYYYLTPPTGSQTVAVSGGGGSAIDTGFMWAAYSGFQQTGQPDSSGSTNLTNTTAFSISTTVVATGCWTIGIFANQGSTPSSYTNGTQRIFAVPNDGMGIFDSNGTVSTGSNTTTINSSLQRSNGILASFITSTAVGPTNVKTFDGVTQSTGIKTYFGVTLANTKSVDGIT